MLILLHLDVYLKETRAKQFRAINTDVHQRYKYNPRLIPRTNDKINGTSKISNRRAFQGLALWCPRKA